MNKTKELVICIISILVLVLAITTNVFATGTPDLNTLLSNTDNNLTNSNVPNNTSGNLIEPTVSNTTSNSIDNNTSNNTINNTVNNTTNNTNNAANNNTVAMPYTGVNNSVIVIIAVCGVSAIYAYKKIRDYNV